MRPHSCCLPHRLRGRLFIVKTYSRTKKAHSLLVTSTSCIWFSQPPRVCGTPPTTKKQGGLLIMKRGLLPSSTPLALAWQVWTAVVTSTIFVAATLEQCQLDCAGNTTQEVAADAALNGGTWSVWDTQRLVGPTEPAAELNATYPLARAPFPLSFHRFCQLGCSYFFGGAPLDTTCSGLCDGTYARNVSVEINDYAEKVRRTSASVHTVDRASIVTSRIM